MLTPATAHLSFSLHRAAQLDLTGDRSELARRASGLHATRAEAEAYARREGPMVVLTPAGEVLRIERQRDAAADERIAAEERTYAERLGQLTWREARPNFST